MVGVDGLTPTDRTYLDFADRFENDLIRHNGSRTLEESMASGWRLLRMLPSSELARVSDAQIAKYVTSEGGLEHA